jgi:hypothetical protein
VQYISILSTILALIFTATILNRYRYKKAKYTLFWGFGLLFFGLGTLSEVVLSYAYSPFWLKLWYLTGAMLSAAWLGQGTIFLLARKPGIAKSLAYGLILLSIISLTLLAIAPMTVDPASYITSSPASGQYKNFMDRQQAPVYIGILVLTILLNTYGAVALVGGALYSAYIFWRKKIFLNRMLGNILIAAGGMVLAMAGSFVRMGLVDWLYLSELIGLILIYAGYLVAIYWKQKPQGKATTGLV